MRNKKYHDALKKDKDYENAQWEKLMKRIETEKVSEQEIVTAMNRMNVIDKKLIKEELYELLG